MLTPNANGDSRLSSWQRVREFAVPPTMIETATARRHAGDWAGACAAAGIDVDLDLRSLTRSHGRDFTARLRGDLRHLAPDLLRWHLPRIAPDGLLRPGLTVALARYPGAARDGRPPPHLVIRTPPAWADAGQRASLALWEGPDSGAGSARYGHPHPSRRFRLDLHPHLWDVRRSDELRARSGIGDGHEESLALDRWAAEAEILLRADGRPAGPVAVRLGGGRALLLHPVDGRAPEHTRPGLALPAAGASSHSARGPRGLRSCDAVADCDAAPGGWRAVVADHVRAVAGRPVLPDAATWVPPDVELLRAGLIDAGRLHPLVARALLPGHRPPVATPRARRTAEGSPSERLVDCRGARHRIGLVDGVLTALDHDPAELAREELLVALTGTPLPCLRVIDRAHRRPDRLPEVRARLDHGDYAGALAVVESLIGPDGLLRAGELHEELEAAAERRITYGLFRSGLLDPGIGPGRGPIRHADLDPRRPRAARRRAAGGR